MTLKTTQVQAEYRGETFTCEKTFYSCSYCGFELHLDWMKEKMQKDLEDAYLAQNSVT